MIIPDQANTTSPIPIYTIVLHDYHTEGDPLASWPPRWRAAVRESEADDE